MDSPLTNPFTIDVLVPDVAQAKVLAAKLAKLPLVAQTLSIDSFIPDDQPAKLALIADANSILSATLTPHERRGAGDAGSGPAGRQDRLRSDRAGARETARQTTSWRRSPMTCAASARRRMPSRQVWTGRSRASCRRRSRHCEPP